jgi:hypothetical protein
LHFSLSHFLVTNLSIFRVTTCNNSFFKWKLCPTKGTTLNTTCVRTECHRTLYTNVDIYWLCQQSESVRIHLRQEVGWGTFIAIALTLPTVTATTIVTNFCFHVSNISLLLCFN